MGRDWILGVILCGGLLTANIASANGPVETVVDAEQVLGELMAIPARQIPQRMLDEAQGIAIIPNVIKVGFIAGARRGHGVVLVRDADGEWSLPQFLTLTGGSVGWQAGIQGTDVVLVFTTRKGIDGLMNGKFTVGVDASAAAGPVGREAAAGIDSTLRSEIYSYSRSRGLFVGVSLDGSALDIDHDAHAFYYGSRSDELPRQIPQSAALLRNHLTELSPSRAANGPQAPQVPNERPIVVNSPRRIESLRRSLLQNNTHLQSILSPDWRPYLALPAELSDPRMRPNPEAMNLVLRRFAHVSNAPEYRQLTERPEFQQTFELLREYDQATQASRPTLQLPPPPTHLRD